MQNKFPEIVGIATQFSHVEIDVDGQPVYSVTSLDYGATMEPGEQREIGSPGATGKTEGKYTVDSITMEMTYLGGVTLIEVLGGEEAEGFMTTPFTITASYTPIGTDRVITDTIVGATVRQHATGGKSDNAEAMTYKFELHALRIDPNGVKPFKVS